MSTILWFRRDLRVEDNPALAAAAAGGGGVLPLCIVEPELWAAPDRAARHWRFLAESLEGLRADLAGLGAPLLVRTGDAVAVLDGLRAAHGVRRLVSNTDIGTQWTATRDQCVADWARANGIEWLDLPRPGVTRGLSHRKGWSQARDRAMRGAPATPEALAPHGLDPGAIPDASDLRLAFDPCPGRQKGGRLRGLDLCQGLPGAGAASRLSPHLAFGTLSPREVARALADRRPSAGARTGAAKAMPARLALRDHSTQIAASAPRIETRCLHPAYDSLPPQPPDAARLEAWQRGETGVPIVDACMRALIHTGWISFAMRALLISVAGGHLGLDWRVTGQHLARLFTDYDPGIHWPQVQMQSGVSGLVAMRIGNPVRQGQDLDPEGRFLRRWLPELRPVPDACLHAPWTWGGAGRILGRAYPAPVVDPLRAARSARQRIWAIRDQPGYREAQDLLLSRHGAPGAGRKDRARPASRQLSLPI